MARFRIIKVTEQLRDDNEMVTEGTHQKDIPK